MKRTVFSRQVSNASISATPSSSKSAKMETVQPLIFGSFRVALGIIREQVSLDLGGFRAGVEAVSLFE